MDFRIAVSREKYEDVERFLKEHGITIKEDGKYIVTEADQKPDFLTVRNEDKQLMHILPEEIVFIEAFGKEVEVHTLRDTYYSTDRMYELENKLNSKEFLRISKSVIIARKHVIRIRPALSMKFVLTMSDKTMLDVTRSYYNDFRKFFNV